MEDRLRRTETAESPGVGNAEGLDAALDVLRSLIRRGEYLRAYDRATTALESSPDDLVLGYLAIVALVRAGATSTALGQLTELFGPHRRMDEPQWTTLMEDVAELRATIAKDGVLRSSGPRRATAAARAAREYEAVLARFHRPSSSANAATMWLLAGEHERARELATETLALVGEARPRSTVDAYWSAATEAEAHLLLGNPDAARTCLERAEREAAGDYGARASTRIQLRLICDAAAIDRSVLEPLRTPCVIHYCGHRIAPPGAVGRFPAAEEGAVRAEVRQALDVAGAGFGYGALASGADIIIAEALLERGAELHVVLPFGADEFVATSVEDSGAEWIERFRNCLGAATSVTIAAESQYLGEPVLFAHSGNVAMGDAVLRASHLDTDVEQLAVWDGRPPVNEAGTAVDVGVWRTSGRATRIIHSRSTLSTDAAAQTNRSHGRRSVRAMLFADVAGYSSLSDAQIPPFLDAVLTPLGSKLREYEAGTEYLNTWGDAIFAVLESVELAADCALALQETIKSLDLKPVAPGVELGLRIGVHAGPVFARPDPIRGDTNFYGEAVARAARIEPRTPVGEVYVTHPFAALLALSGRADLVCQYVGRLPAAKDYGTFPMYVLTQTDLRDP